MVKLLGEKMPMKFANYKLQIVNCLRNKTICYLLFLALFFSYCLNLSAQNITITARVDSNNIRVGDWLTLHLEIQHPPNALLQRPVITDSLRGIELVRVDSLPQKTSGQNVIESANFIVTSFDSGTYVIPPFLVKYSTIEDATMRSAESSPIPIFVHGIAVDTSKEIKDIKSPIAVSLSFAEMLPYFLAVIGVALIGWLIYYVLKKRRKGESIIPEAPPRPAHEVALEALRSLEAEQLWQRGKIKEYHSKITDILRIYIERRLNVQAMEMITDEIMSASAILNLEPATGTSLREILTLADLVKFAKLQPLAQENERSFTQAKTFVENTSKPNVEMNEVGTVQEVSI